MLKTIKAAVKGSPLEPAARWVLDAYGGLKFSSHIGRMNRLYDEQTAQIMARVLSDQSCCVDVGAHKGSVLEQILRAAPEGRHFAFEPLPDYAERLKSNYPRVEVHNVALSDQSGESLFYHRTKSPGTSSLHSDNDYFDKTPPEVIRVRTVPLDAIIPEDCRIDLIKIDVEGAQLQVLRGAANTIKRCRPYIVFEHGRNRARDCEAIYQLLVHECGLSISLMGDWLAHRKPLTLESFRHQVGGDWYQRRVINWYFLAHPQHAPR